MLRGACRAGRADRGGARYRDRPSGV